MNSTLNNTFTRQDCYTKYLTEVMRFARETNEYLFPDDVKRRAGFEERGYFLTGDVDYHRVAPIAGAITPVPGGVGPLTVTMLLANTLLSAQRRLGTGSTDRA